MDVCWQGKLTVCNKIARVRVEPVYILVDSHFFCTAEVPFATVDSVDTQCSVGSIEIWQVRRFRRRRDHIWCDGSAWSDITRRDTFCTALHQKPAEHAALLADPLRQCSSVYAAY